MVLEKGLIRLIEKNIVQKLLRRRLYTYKNA
jgi:hypothetical protein